ncbi:MAG: YraN family protein [Nitrospirota bacterium]
MRSLGDKGEGLAGAFLEKKGYRLLARNWRGPSGEVDLIARDGEVVVFVEVKTRRARRFGDALEAVDTRKQEKIRQTALSYLSRLRPEPPVRFDVVTVFLERDGSPRVEHLPGAF